MTVKLLIEHHLEFLSLKGGCRGSPVYVHVKMPHCWKSYVAAHLCLLLIPNQFKDSYKTDINVDDLLKSIIVTSKSPN